MMALVMMFGEPFGLEVDLAGWLTLVLNWEPLIHTMTKSKGAELRRADSDALILANIVVPNVEVQVISQVVHLDIEVLIVPFGSLSSILVY